jgi:hypothetical protein
LHKHHPVEVTCGSFEKQSVEANLHPGHGNGWPSHAATNPAGSDIDSHCKSADRDKKEDIPHTWNHWVLDDLKRKIVPTHSAICTDEHGSQWNHLKL